MVIGKGLDVNVVGIIVGVEMLSYEDIEIVGFEMVVVWVYWFLFIV